MKTLDIDDKWSIEYDPDNNDRPGKLTRYGQTAVMDYNNPFVAMFFALLEAREQLDQAEADT